MLRPRRAEPAAWRAAKALAGEVMSGAYAVGSRLPVEQDLAVKLDVGRSTVREAIKMLAGKGLLDVSPKRGTTVRSAHEWQQLDPDLLNWRLTRGEDLGRFFRDLAEIRSMIEPFAAQTAALRRTDADVARIYRALAEMRQAEPDAQRILDADIVFHQAVAAASGNPLLQQLAHNLEPALRKGIDTANRDHDGAYAAIVNLHQEVADAIARQDPERAAAASRRLIQRNEERSIESAAQRAIAH